MKFCKKEIFLCSIIVFLILFNYSSYSENQIYKVEINPLNRVLIYFSTYVPEFSTQLTPDKKKLIIRLKGVTISESNKETKANGIIQSVYLSKYGNDLEINILLKEKRGYSSCVLPYTNALLIETFDWSKVSQAEDNFYSGLIAYNDGLFSVAKKHFKTAEIDNLANAFAINGLIYLREADLKVAEEKLLIAEKKNSNISDIFAALSHLYALKKNDELSNHYKNLFIQKSGIKSFNYIQIGNIKSNEINTDSSLTLLDKNLISNENKDTVTKNTTVVLDTNKKEINLANIESNSSNKSTISFIIDTLKYIGIFLIFFAFVLIVFYFKWRNDQLKFKNEIVNEIKKDEELLKQKRRKAEKARPRPYQTSTKNAANIYKKQQEESVRIAKINNDDETFRNISDIKQLALEIIESKNAQDSIDDNLLSNSIESIKNEHFSEEEIEKESKVETVTNEPIIDEIINDDYINDSEPMDSRLEFALHLQKENQKIKDEKIRNIDDELDTDNDNLTQIAKNAGVEKSVLETKKNIANLQSDKDLLSKLSEKFSVNKKED